MATTAAVVGTAGAVSHHQQSKYAAKDQAAYDEQQAQMQAQAEVAQLPAQPAPAAPAVIDLTGELEKLASLKASGVLTDEEFTAAKAQLLST